DAINRLVKTIGARAKLSFGVHAHMLRHACGYALANAGHDTPHQLATDAESDGGPHVITFRRIIVHPGGREEIEGQTPKQLAAPASPVLPKSDEIEIDPNDIKELDS